MRACLWADEINPNIYVQCVEVNHPCSNTDKQCFHVHISYRFIPVVPHEAVAEVSKINRKPIEEIGCCESGVAERIHWWTKRCLRSPLFLSLSVTIYLPTYLSSMYLSIYLSLDLSISLSLSSNYLSTYLPTVPTYLSTYLPTYPSIYLSISLFHLSICLAVYLSIYLSICLPVYLWCSVIQCNVV